MNTVTSTRQLSCVLLVAAAVGLLEIATCSPSGASSSRAAGAGASQESHCLTQPEGPTSTVCPPGSPTISAVSGGLALGRYAVTPDGTAYNEGITLPNQ